MKILHSGDCGVTSTGLNHLEWSATSGPLDCSIVNYIELPTKSDVITALAIDGADNLWVCLYPPNCPLVSRLAAMAQHSKHKEEYLGLIVYLHAY